MPIVGFNLTNIQAEKKNQINEDTKISINSKLGITDLKKEDLPTGKTKTKGLKFDFEFSLEYQPNIAKIIINGFIYFMDDSANIEELVKNWQKNKKLPVEIQQQILSMVILKTTIKALSLEQEINVPPHIPFPSVQPVPKKSAEGYIG